MRLERQGVRAGDHTGDLIVEIQIVLPSVRDERSKELLREFGRLNDVNVRGHLFGEAEAHAHANRE
jgi:DnaJ-class molecular chaperone